MLFVFFCLFHLTPNTASQQEKAQHTTLCDWIPFDFIHLVPFEHRMASHTAWHACIPRRALIATNEWVDWISLLPLYTNAGILMID